MERQVRQKRVEQLNSCSPLFPNIYRVLVREELVPQSGEGNPVPALSETYCWRQILNEDVIFTHFAPFSIKHGSSVGQIITSIPIYSSHNLSCLKTALHKTRRWHSCKASDVWIMLQVQVGGCASVAVTRKSNRA